MTECQALLATAFEVAATYVQSHEQSGVNCNWRGMADTIRDFTNADAQAALDARINAAKEEGRVMGLREAAEIARGMNNGETAKAIHRALFAKIKEADHE